MSKKTTESNKESAAPTNLELVLETKTVKTFKPIITVPGEQIAAATLEQLEGLQKAVKAQYERADKESIFSEIREVQKILMANPIKRDGKGQPILQPIRDQQGNTQAMVPQEDLPSLEEQRPRNRMLWAIEEALKGKKPGDVKRIVVKFHSVPDLKKPKYADALLLSKLVEWDTQKNMGLGVHFVDFAMKFNHIRNEAGDLVEDTETRETLKTQANAIISQGA